MALVLVFATLALVVGLVLDLFTIGLGASRAMPAPSAISPVRAVSPMLEIQQSTGIPGAHQFVNMGEMESAEPVREGASPSLQGILRFSTGDPCVGIELVARGISGAVDKDVDTTTNSAGRFEIRGLDEVALVGCRSTLLAHGLGERTGSPYLYSAREDGICVGNLDLLLPIRVLDVDVGISGASSHFSVLCREVDGRRGCRAMSANLNSRGHALFPVDAPMRYILSAVVDGVSTAEEAVCIEVSSPYQTQLRMIIQHPSVGLLRVGIRGADSFMAVPEVLGPLSACTVVGVHLAKGTDGVWTALVPAGECTVLVHPSSRLRRKGFPSVWRPMQTLRRQVQVVPLPKTTDVSFELSGGGGLALTLCIDGRCDGVGTGSVGLRGASEEALSGAKCVLLNGSDTLELVLFVAGSDGGVDFRTLPCREMLTWQIIPVGEYQLVVDVPGYQVMRRTVVINEGRFTEKVIYL